MNAKTGDRRSFFAALFGIVAVAQFVIVLFVFAWLNNEFHLISDYISKLGARGEPLAIWWNAFGFGSTGLNLAIFGWLFGTIVNDKVMGACFVLAGVGFSLAAIPADLADEQSGLSKAHFASVCFSLAGWCLALSRMVSAKHADAFARRSAQITVSLSILPVGFSGVGICPEPVAHRLILLVTFGWILVSSIRLLKESSGRPENPINYTLN